MIDNKIDIYEIFENPLLAEVILELRFPTRLKIPSYIADFQEDILSEFPKLKEIFEKKVRISPEMESEVYKYWEFANPQNKTRCRIFNNKFVLVSNEYKSWEKHHSTRGFKYIADFLLKAFFSRISINQFDRVGLRYINKVEIEDDKEKWFKKYFIPLFNMKYYSIGEMNENLVRIRHKKGDNNNITIQSTFIKEEDTWFYILDFDAYSTKVRNESLNYRINTLHEIILKEFHSLITDECREKLRGGS